MSKKGMALTAIFILILILSSMPVSAESQNAPIQLSLFTPVQIFSEDYTISGVRLNLLYGRNVSVTGLDWGLVNHTTSGMSMGVQLGFLSINEADFMGWQNSAGNIVMGDMEGFQCGVVNYAGYANGFQLGLVNYAVSMKGLQIGLVNIIKQGGQFPVFPIVNWSF